MTEPTPPSTPPAGGGEGGGEGGGGGKGGGGNSGGSRPKLPKVSLDSPIIPVALMIIGGYLMWFGIHYWRSDTSSPTDPIKALLRGTEQPPIDGGGTDRLRAAEFADLFAPEAGVSPGGGSAGTGTGSSSSIAQDALKYVGAGYVFGGDASKIGTWDCSSFVSYVLGHDFNLPLPGGKWGDPGFPPHAHGPTTGSYLLYGSPINRNQLQAGDLVVWATHMGIAISGTEIVAARTTASGTGTSNIDAVTTELAETVHFRRIAGAAGAEKATTG